MIELINGIHHMPQLRYTVDKSGNLVRHEWVAATGGVHAGNIIGSGYKSLFDAKRAVDFP